MREAMSGAIRLRDRQGLRWYERQGRTGTTGSGCRGFEVQNDEVVWEAIGSHRGSQSRRKMMLAINTVQLLEGFSTDHLFLSLMGVHLDINTQNRWEAGKTLAYLEWGVGLKGAAVSCFPTYWCGSCLPTKA